jgi:ParB family chromosome partitioning protein
MSSSKRPAMGRGLSALLKSETNNVQEEVSSEAIISETFELAIDKIEPNPSQPRSNFENNPLHDLAISIKSLGIIQPITVRSVKHDKYQIISGERRYRAAKIVGLKSIPVFVRLADDQEILEMALVENIQRQDLDPMEIAISYNRLIEDCNLTQQQVSEKVGKNRSTVANYIGLLKLSPLVQAGLRDRDISMGHARALVGLSESSESDMLYHRCIKGSWSVRQLETAVRAIGKGIKSPILTEDAQAANVFSNKTGLTSKVIIKSNGEGQVILSFKDSEELTNALNRIR